MVLVVAVVAQIAFFIATRDRKPHWEILPPVPTERMLGAAAFGDRQFLYRVLVLALQNFGDTGGRITALKDYDMTEVVGWLEALDSLDYRAQHHVALSMRYFSQTQDRPRLRQLLAWLEGHVAKDPEHKAWWLSNGIMLAERRLSDLPLALELAERLASYDFPSTRIEALQYPAYILEKMGDFEGAATIVERIVERNDGRFSKEDIEWSKGYAAALHEAGRRWRLAGGQGPIPP
jgi:tetratricopeptide (TPR) repeat protein